MKKYFLKLLSILLSLSLLGGCAAETTAQEDDTLEISAPAPTANAAESSTLLGTTADSVFSLNAIFDSSFNPYRLTSAWNRVVDMLVYEPLIEIDGDFEAQPSIITAWSTEDGITWSFSVDITRKFHSGAAVTAYDCVYTLTYAKESDSYSDRFDSVSEISSIDSSTFQVKLSGTNWQFYKLLNIPCIESNTYYYDHPGGTGPYKFADTGDMLLLDENHPDAAEMPLLRIYLKEYQGAADILQAFESSVIDLVINDPTAMSNLGYSKTNIIRYVDSTNMHYLGYNLQSMLMSQTAIRAAMTYIVDRSTIVSSCMSGAAVAAALPVHPNNSLYPQDLARSLSYEPENFAQALEGLGLMDVDGDGYLEYFSGATGLKLELDFIVCSDSSAKVSAARKIVSEMTDAGLSVTLRELSYEDYEQALRDGDYDIYYAEIKIRADWDISELFRADWSASDSLNFSRGSDSMMLSYYTQYLASPPESEEAAMQSLCEYLSQMGYITVVCFERSEVLYHRGVIQGMQPTQDNIFNDMQSWEIDLAAEQS